MNINKKLFDLDDVYLKFSHGEVWSNLIKLKNVRDSITYVVEETTDELEKIILREQLIYVNKNIKTFEDALLCHESKIIEKRMSIGELGMFYLN